MTATANHPDQEKPLSTARRFTTFGRLPALATVLVVALVARVLAAVVLQSFVGKLGQDRLCLFDDANYYWLLAQTIREGTVYQIVEWGTISHKALRTPGYPLFLAACQAVIGEWPLGVRLGQAVLGMVSVGLVYVLTVRLGPSPRLPSASGVFPRAAPLAAAALAAINPYYVAISELLLSEALFMPLLLATLWGLAILWRKSDEPDHLTSTHHALIAIATGAAAAAAILTRPSFALFIPFVLVCWLVDSAVSRDRTSLTKAIRGALLIVFGLALVMSPWWVRNAQTYGRFIPTSIWFGASLYDGLNPKATGASEMSFLAEPDIRTLGELDQDSALTRRSLEFVRENPSRSLELALIKLGRYWSPWPNADQFGSLKVAVASAIVVIPTYALILVGAWNRRRDMRALVLLAGPLIYFCAVHLVFVSSIRYRIPGEMVAAGLAGIGFQLMAVFKPTYSGHVPDIPCHVVKS
jgi:4-amino-4-deoxy-L-arabinose transferase-like glycosyltransferase